MSSPRSLSPPLELHLVEHALSLAIRHAVRQDTAGDNVGHQLADLLNVLPRSLSPMLTRLALLQLPWVDLDFCSRIGDLNLLQFVVDDWFRTRPNSRAMQHATQGQRRRPLQWSRDALTFAAERGHVHILHWWAEQRQLLITMDWAQIASSAARAGRIEVLYWCDVNRPPGTHLPDLYLHSDLTYSVEVMKWWMEHLPAPDNTAFASEDLNMFVIKATRAGSVEGLQWLYDQGLPLDFSVIVQEANNHGQLAVLDWLLAMVPRDSLLDTCATYVRRYSSSGGSVSPCSALYFLLFDTNQRQVIDWWIAHAPWALFFDPTEARRAALVCARAGFLPPLRSLLDTRLVAPSRDLLIAGCESGDVRVPTYLYDRGCWTAPEPVCDCRSPVCFKDAYVAASEAASVPILDWLFGVIPLDVQSASRAIEQCGRKQSAAVLDWWLDKVPGVLSQLAPVGYPRLSAHLANACRTGNLAFVERWTKAALDAGVAPRLDTACAYAASEEGQLDVLDYLLATVPDLVHNGTGACMTAASSCGCVPALEWWKQHGRMPDTCPTYAIDSASATGYVDVLDWWLQKSGLPLQFTNQAMDNASVNGHTRALEWWFTAARTHGIQLLYSPAALTIDTADAVPGPVRIQVLRWWHLRGFTFPTAFARYRTLPWPATVEEQLNCVFVSGSVMELDLLLKLGVRLGSKDVSLLDHASHFGHVAVLEFLLHDLPSFNDNVSMDVILTAAKRGDTATWEWWKRTGVFDPEQLEASLKEALEHGW